MMQSRYVSDEVMNMKINLNICAGLLILILVAITCLVPAAGAVAAGEGPLTIDSKHVYEGMAKSYAEGYLPGVSGGKATVILPLLSDSVTDPLTVSVNLGDPSLSPFVYRNYEKMFTKESCPFDGGSNEYYPVQFSLELTKNRINGCYPVTFTVRGTDTGGGETFAQDFTLYVNISDGAAPPGSEPAPPSGPEPALEPASQPKLMVVSYALQGGQLAAGEKASLTVTVRNTSSRQQVKNIKLSFADESGEIWPEGTGATYCAQIGAGGAYTWKFAVNALTTAQSRPHPALITMEYEDGMGQPYSTSDRIILQLRQPVRLEYEEPSLPPRVTQGDTVPFSMTLMNLGKSTIYNVLLKFEIPGLAGGGGVLVGTIPPGESQSGATNFRVDSDLPSDVSGTLTLSYEDDYGESYEKEIALATTIEKKIETPPPSGGDKDADSPVPPWIFWASGAVLLLAAAFLGFRWYRARTAAEEDERRL